MPDSLTIYDASSINFRRSVRYGLGVLKTSVEYRLNKSDVRRYPYLQINRALESRTEDHSSVGLPLT